MAAILFSKFRFNFKGLRKHLNLVHISRIVIIDFEGKSEAYPDIFVG